MLRPGPARPRRLAAPARAVQIAAAAARGRPLADRKNSRASSRTGSSEESPPAGQSVPPGLPAFLAAHSRSHGSAGSGRGPASRRPSLIGEKPCLSSCNASHWLRRAEWAGRKGRWRMAAGRLRGWTAAKRAAVGSCSRSSAFASCPAWAMAPPPTPARSPPSQVPPSSERPPPAGAAGGLRGPGRPHSPSLRRDVVRRLPVGSRLLPCLPRSGRAACPLHAPAPQVRQVHVRERAADGHRGTHHRRHPHKYGKGRGCADPSGGRGMAVFPGMEVSVLALFPPCPTSERVGPRVRLCPGHTKCAQRVQSQGVFHISEHLEENLSGLVSVSRPG